LLYPILLAAFHANIAPVISGQSAEPALRSAAAVLFLLLAFAAPIVALLGAMMLGELAAPSVTQRRARTTALLAVAAPSLFVFLGVEFYMLHDPVPDTWVWVAFWLAMATLAGFWRKETPAPPPANAAPAPPRVAHGISALAIIAIFLAMHLANHLTFILGPDTYRAVMRAIRYVYRQEFVQPYWLRFSCFRSAAGCTSPHTPTCGRWTVSAPSRSLAAFFGGVRARTQELCIRVCAALSQHRQRLDLRHRRAVRVD
jgi:hypothetical protein